MTAYYFCNLVDKTNKQVSVVFWTCHSLNKFFLFWVFLYNFVALLIGMRKDSFMH